MDFHPAVIDIEHPRAGYRDMGADCRDGQRIRVASACAHRIGLGRRAHTDRFDDKVALLSGNVGGVDVFGLAGVQA
jgi:hypothetical protein